MDTSTMSPPLSSRSRSSSLDSSFDEEYFSKTYVPLSNLPTPPPSSHYNVDSHAQSENAIEERLDPNLFGPATHLTNLIPSSASLTTASTPLVQSILARAKLPRKTIALACCMLDSLNCRFALPWRRGFPLNAPLIPFGLDFTRGPEQHIDSIRPEINILAALVLAVKFLDDTQQSTRHYVTVWGKDLWTCDQLNYTVQMIHENLGYRIKSLWEEDIIGQAEKDMERAGRDSQPPRPCQDTEDWDTDTYIGSYESTDRNIFTAGKAVVGFGSLITPLETPLETPRPGLVRETKFIPRTTITTPSELTGRRENDPYRLPVSFAKKTAAEESNPLFEESMLEGLGYGFR